MACHSKSCAIHVSPRLTSIYMRIVEIIEIDEEICAECLFESIRELLPIGEFPLLNQPTQWGTA
jgi:hypothetical protein